MIKLIKVLTCYLLFISPANASLNEVDKMNIFNRNILTNGGFENGKAGWSASGGSFAVTTTAPMTGLAHATWDSSGSSQTLTSTAVSIPAGQYGRNAVATCLITTPSGTATHTIQAYDGSSILSSVSITSSTTPTRASTNFIMPSSGSISVRLVSVAADEPSISIDSCFVGPAEGYNLSDMAQGQFIGSAYIAGAASCNPSRTSTSLGAFSTAAACPGPTVENNPGPGVIQTTDTDLPKFTVNNLPPGRYRVVMTVPVQTSSTGVDAEIAINDGTTTVGRIGSTNASSQYNTITTEGIFEYTTSGNRTFEVYGSSASVTVRVVTDQARSFLRFSIYRFPLTTELGFKPDALANSWSGYHDHTCLWSTTSASLVLPAGDATCSMTQVTNSSFGTVATVSDGTGPQPAISFTPTRAGRYEVCATAIGYSDTDLSNNFRALSDGTTTLSRSIFRHLTGANNPITLCGIIVASSTTSTQVQLHMARSSGTSSTGMISGAASPGAAINWSIVQIDQQIPAPLLVNSVVNPNSGVTNVVSAYITNSGTPAVSSQDGTWISSLTDNGTGDTTVNISAGTFSSTPRCVCSSRAAAAGDIICGFDTATTHTSTVVRVQTSTTAGAGTDKDFDIICIGPR